MLSDISSVSQFDASSWSGQGTDRESDSDLASRQVMNQTGVLNDVVNPTNLPAADYVGRLQEAHRHVSSQVVDWDQTQQNSALGRIERQIAELRQLVSLAIESNIQPKSVGTSEPAISYFDIASLSVKSNSSSELNVKSKPAPRKDNPQRAEGGSTSVVVNPDLKLPESSALGRTGDQLPASEFPMPQARTAAVDEKQGDLIGLLDRLPNPKPIDIDSATIADLRNACNERETYIVQLTRWIRASRTASLPSNWDELQNVPDALRDRLETLSNRLEEQIRLAEVEMSLERARLNRERTRLQTEREALLKQAQKLGIQSLDELDNSAGLSNSQGDRGWMRFLGGGK